MVSIKQTKMIDSSLLCPLLFFFLIVASPITADSKIYDECSPIQFTPQTPNEFIVNSLFNTLIESSAITNFNKYEGLVNGLYQCRGDIDSSRCHDCVSSAVKQLKSICPFSVGGVIQLDECFLKYDNQPFFGVKNTGEMWKRCGPTVNYSSNALNSKGDALENLMAGNRNYFHSGDYGILRGVTQCVQDVTPADCQDCLVQASRLLRSQCDASSGWVDIFLGSCYFRYVDPNIGHSSNYYTSKDHAGGNVWKIAGICVGVLVGLAAAATAAVTFSIKIKKFMINCCNCFNG